MDQLQNLAILYVPRVVGALLILVGGIIFAFIARRVSTWLLQHLGFDHLGERAGVTSILKQRNVQRMPSVLVGTLIFYGVLVLTMLTALGSLGLEFLAGTLNQVFLFAPRALLGVLLLFLGTAAAGLLAELTGQALANAGIARAGGLRTFVRYSVIFVTVLLVAAVLEIDVTILIIIAVLVLGGVVLAAALAVGLGLRELSHNIVAGRYISEGLAEGDRVRLDGASGTIEHIGHAVTSVRDDDGTVSLIPNAHFMAQIIKKIEREEP